MKRRHARSQPLTEAEASRLPKYSIGVVSKLVGVPAQMLRRYEEAGLLSPARQEGKNRLYSDQDVATLEEIASLSDEGVNAAGIKRILQMRAQIHRLQQEVKVARQGQTEEEEHALDREEHEGGAPDPA